MEFKHNEIGELNTQRANLKVNEDETQKKGFFEGLFRKWAKKTSKNIGD